VATGVAWVLRVVLRPALTVAAAVVVMAGPGPLWARITASVATIAVRPWRRWWVVLPLLVLVGAVTLDLVAVELIAARTMVTGLALLLGTHQAAANGRRRLVGGRREPMRSARAVYADHLAAVRAGDDLEAADLLVEYVMASWCEADAAEEWLAARRWFAYFVLRRPGVLPPRPALGLAMRRMVTIEQAVTALPAISGSLAAAAVAAGVTWQRTVTIAGWHTPAAVPAALLAAVAGYCAAQAANPYRRRRMIPVVAVALGLLVPLAGVRTTGVFLIVVAVAGVTAQLRVATQQRQLAAPLRVIPVGLNVAGMAGYGRHRAIRRIVQRGDIVLAVAALHDLCDDMAARRPQLSAVAYAEIAMLELDRRRPQDAVDAVTRAEQLLPPRARENVTGFVQAALGRTRLTVGDLSGAEIALRVAAETLVDPVARIDNDVTLARTVMRSGRIDEAVSILVTASLRLRMEAGLFALLDGLVSAAWARYYAGETDLARRQAEELIEFFGDAPTVTVELTGEAALVWQRALAETHLLLGRLAVEEGDTTRAARPCRRPPNASTTAARRTCSARYASCKAAAWPLTRSTLRPSTGSPRVSVCWSASADSFARICTEVSLSPPPRPCTTSPSPCCPMRGSPARPRQAGRLLSSWNHCGAVQLPSCCAKAASASWSSFPPRPGSCSLRSRRPRPTGRPPTPTRRWPRCVTN